MVLVNARDVRDGWRNFLALVFCKLRHAAAIAPLRSYVSSLPRS